jgi:hypothetical protein
MKKNIIIFLCMAIFACGENHKPTVKIKKLNYKKRISNTLGMDLVYIKSGTFLMGPDYKLHYSGRECV